MQKISIITVVKNGMPYLESALRSFEAQDYQNKELIVVYSQSNDETKNFLLQNKSKIDELILDNDNLGMYHAINLGIKKATGDLIGLLHADDIFYSEKILTIIASKFEEKKFDLCSQFINSIGFNHFC